MDKKTECLRVVDEKFMVLDMKDPTPREDELLQLSDQVLNATYEILDPKVLESIKDLEMAQKGMKEIG